MWKEKVSGKISFDEVGQVVTGRITEIKVQQMLTGEVNSYALVTDEGETMSFLGTTVLDRLLGHELDSLVKIEYQGTTKTGSGRPLKNFKVEVWEDEELPPEDKKKKK